MADLTKVGRIAFREEGDMWNAYYALPDTMEGALWLGSIRMAAVVENHVRKTAFMNLMRGLVGDVLSERTGAPVEWKEPVAAPDSERTKK